jgi:soluble cytochrome b562
MKILSLQKAIASFAILAAFVIGMHPASSRADDHETELGGKMKIIGKSVKALKGQISDATKQQSTIDLLEAAKKAATEAKDLKPDKTKDVPAADQAKFIADYQAEMDKLIGDFGKIEDAVKAGKYDDATKLYGDLNGVKRDGHKQFQADKD